MGWREREREGERERERERDRQRVRGWHPRLTLPNRSHSDLGDGFQSDKEPFGDVFPGSS